MHERIDLVGPVTPSSMKHEETIAREFLEKRFEMQPLYEPRGQNTPPDFSIKRIAFEVRRLNQHYIYPDGTIEGLEQVEYSLRRALFRELEKTRFSSERGSFYVLLNYARPLPVKAGEIARKLAREAHLHYSEGSTRKKTITAHGVTLQLLPATLAQGKAFVLGSDSDDDSGGFVGDIYLSNIRLALQEKIRKTRNIADKFDRWVLILVDTIIPGYSWKDDIAALKLDLEHFDSVLVINLDGSLSMEWPNRSLDDLGL